MYTVYALHTVSVGRWVNTVSDAGYVRRWVYPGYTVSDAGCVRCWVYTVYTLYTVSVRRWVFKMLGVHCVHIVHCECQTLGV